MIDPDTIARIRDRLSIAEIVGESVKLERRGRSLLGLCPFHKEKSPSFHVNEERGRYHCFGCQASGDVFSFVQNVEGLTFIEALQKLAERAGVRLEDEATPEERRQRSEEKRREQALYDANAAAATFFERMLGEHPGAKTAEDELARRALPFGGPADAVLRAFRVGYAPEGWDTLAEHLRRAGIDPRAAEVAGLIAPRKSGGGYYDRFRQRLMFAVIDLQGRVVAFSGRALPSSTPSDEAPAKYINSPETPIYKKRSTVFGLFQARGALRGGAPCVVVEGNFDVVALQARGVAGAVAPLGTAFTEDQGRAIRRFTHDVVFLFDGDRAGREATQKAREPARAAQLRARVARLPDGMDPDDFSRVRGAAALGEVIKSARGMLDYLIAEQLDDRFASSDPEASARALRAVLELLATEDDPAVRALAQKHVVQLAQRLGIADARTFASLEASVIATLRRSAPDSNVAHSAGDSGRANREVGEGRRSTPGRHEDGEPPSRHEMQGGRKDAKSRGIDALTESIVGALLDFPELLDSDELIEYSDQMMGDLARTVASLRAARTGAALANFAEALAKMPASVRPFAEARLAAPVYQNLGAAKMEFIVNLRKLESSALSRQVRGAAVELERVRQWGDTSREDELLRAAAEAARRKRDL